MKSSLKQIEEIQDSAKTENITNLTDEVPGPLL